MYRFSIGGQEWILRFSPHIEIEPEIKQAIVSTILQLGSELQTYSHGESFVIMNDHVGIIVFNVEKIPSFMLTVSNIVSEDNWYIQNNLTLKKYKK
ncbi:hypothetical protein [Cytobacillus massiliigabonensis]|uniref:hypothetical protein n=1 Tax=Cytobacillus massiliigabonensis TaxID=1871011 RepID=UPI000C840262|nr:hypothetical protein [Cytobacillus massiliigabonensis]